MNFLIGSFVFGAIGFVAFTYGKKQGLWKTALLGISLMLYTWFTPSALYVYIVGIALTAGLFICKE